MESAVIDASWDLFDQLRPAPVESTEEAPTWADYLCKACGGRKSYDVFDDLPVCIDCGLQDDYFISDEPEWRSGIDESGQVCDPSRVGAPVNTDHFSAAWGMGTIIRTKGGKGTKMARIHQHSTMNHRDRALFHAYAGMDRIGRDVLYLPDAVMYAAKIKYREFNSAVLTRGAVRNGIKANCIFQACREFGVARTTYEIADAFGIPAKDMSRTFQMYQEKMPETDVHVTTPADLVPRFFNSLTCVPETDKGRVRMKVIKVCRTLDDNLELMGRTPKAVACAVMSIVLTDLGYAPKRADLCAICDVSATTLAKIESIIRAQLKDKPA